MKNRKDIDRMKNEVLTAYKYRQAIKEFQKDKLIPEEDFNYILEAGRLSPSSFGWEPWKFLVVQNKELREKLKESAWGAGKQLDSASHFMIIMALKADALAPTSDYLKYITREINHLPAEYEAMKLDFYGKFQKNDFDLTDARKIFDWSTKQTYIPLGNMMTAAAHIGIDSCPIEGFSIKKIEELLESEKIIDTNKYGVSVLVAFGYKAVDLDWPKTRRPLEEVVQWIK